MNIEDFKIADKGTDCNFFDLPKEAQDIANALISQSTSRNNLIALLDGSEYLREALKSTSTYLKEVDSIMRYYDYFSGA